MQGRSDSLLGAIQDAEDPDDNVTIDPAELKLPSEDVYAVYNQGGRMVGSSAISSMELMARSYDGFHEVVIGHSRYRVLQRDALRVIDRAENGGVGLKRPVTIVYASPEDHLWHEIFEAVRFYLIAIAFSTGVSVAVVGLLVTKALSPLLELATAAEQLAPPALSFSPPPSVMRVRELRPLAIVLGDSINRLRAAFAKQHQFVGDAAHELKTAVSVVRSSVQLLMLKRRSPAEYEKGLDRILEDSERVETLVAQMLQLANLEETSAAYSPAVSLSDLATEVLERLNPYAEERGLSLRLIASEHVLVPLQPERVTVLISNLVMNAIQHSFSGQAVVVTVTETVEKGPVLRVDDSGSGIVSAALPHVFERFFREDTSRSRKTGGTGLGLSICKSIVEKAGGRIGIESEPGKGTHVIVTFITA